jgi:hypothetical protein
MRSKYRRKDAAKADIDLIVHNAFGIVTGWHDGPKAAFGRLLRHVRHRSDLLRPARACGRYDPKGYADVLAGLLALAAFHPEWLRPVEGWVPTGENPLPQFSSLARHLLATYPVPAFMTSVWFQGWDDGARRQQRWYAHIGAGRNIRKADLPLRHTKMMAHHFLRAPHHLSVEEALRWGQVRGLGGSEPLARAVAATRLGRSFDDEDFWSTVVRFLVDHPELRPSQVGPVVDYLHHRRFVPQDVLVEEGELTGLGPSQPDLTMKGRTARSLLRQVREWNERLKLPTGITTQWWKPSGIGPFRHVERDGEAGLRCWTIRELTSGEQLRREGAALRHCVGRYAGACARRTTTIWSMRFEDGGRRFRVMTIEVDPATRTIRQARRRGNAPPNEKALGVLRRWANQEGLRLEFWINGALVLE